MPGLVGLLTTMPRQRAERQLLEMVRSLMYEPFYRTGTWIDERLGVYIGWTVPKNAFADGMPLRNERGDVVLLFSGEEFPEPGTSRRLKNRGHDVDGDGPEYLVHLAEEDASFPVTLNGRFHGLLVNRTRGTATLFNDRYGMHRLYYNQSKDGLYFAAEAKAILAVRPELRRIDPKGLGEFITCGCVLEDRTLFDSVDVLPCASAWTIRNGSVEAKNRYFDPREWEDQSSLTPDSYDQELRDIFDQKLPRYFEGRQPIGMSLTGGLDTRMVMAWQRRPPESLPCYTFGGMLRDCADVSVARQIARVCGQQHQVITVGKDFLARFHDYAERTVYLSDGCADVSRAPDLYVNRMAREIAPVRMTGNYGGEVLRHVRAFKPMELQFELFPGELRSAIRHARETYAQLLQGHPLSFAVFRQAPWHHYGLLALEQTQISVRSPFLDNDLVRTVFRAPASSLTSDAACLRLIVAGDPRLGMIRTDRGPLHRGLWQTARRAGIELTRKAEYAYDYGMPQWIAPIDRLLAGVRPERLFLGRHKFFHFRLWYRDLLSRYVRDMLLDPQALSRSYVERTRVKALVDSHTAGLGNYTLEIHKLLTLELIHRLFLDPQPVRETAPVSRQTVNAC